ncbi:hypothetical protein BD779DRAFT_1477926 [Infundibulicybe gibba]|nr:hypothetical protein BD779DRAFT_1477926 [Infundibulicybe gibba]
MSYNLVLSCLGVLDLPLLLSLRLIGHWSLSSTQVLLVASTFTIQYILQGLRADAFLESFQSVGFTWCTDVGRFFLAAAAPLLTIKLLVKASPTPRLGTIGKTLNGEFGTPVADRLPNCIFLIEGHCGGDEFGAAKSADIIARVLHDPGFGSADDISELVSRDIANLISAGIYIADLWLRLGTMGETLNILLQIFYLGSLLWVPQTFFNDNATRKDVNA